jgi:hypothetical protein
MAHQVLQEHLVQVEVQVLLEHRVLTVLQVHHVQVVHLVLLVLLVHQEL